MKVSQNDVRYGIYWRNLRGDEVSLTGFRKRIEAENHAHKNLTVAHVIHGYVQPASAR